MPRFGLIGCGNFGQHLGRQVAAAAGLAAVADADPEAARRFADEVGAAAVALSDLPGAVDAVFVATPNYTHRTVVCAALEAGLHVFCEKPMALTVADCDAMLATARRCGRKLMVGHMQRLKPTLAQVRELVQAGAVGTPLSVSMCRREALIRAPGWLREREKVGGLLFQSTVHEIDFLRSVFGDVDRVYAEAAARPIQPYLDFPDNIFVQLRFTSGVIGALQACMSDRLDQYTGTVTGTDGTLAFDLNAGSVRWRRSDGGAGEWCNDNGEEAAHAAVVAAFVRWVAGGAAPPVTALDGREAVAVACAAIASISLGAPQELTGL